MSKSLNVNLSTDIAKQINGKATDCFNNAYQAVLLTEGAIYVQGFLVLSVELGSVVIEYAWIELDEQIIDPTLPYINAKEQELYYFPAQHLSVKQLNAAVEEAIEDYPEDDPLPVYGDTPYDYYGDRMLGGIEYTAAYKAAEAKCIELNSQNTLENN